MPATVTLLTDYGLQDEYVGVCHGVIARIAPEARVIDLTHGVPRHAIRSGALALRRALPFTPPGVHVAVVDPGVGGPRRGIALRCVDRLLVGPDNGLLIPAAEHLGGVEEAVDLASSPWLLEPVSATFHGRDVFAPVAAAIAGGAAVAEAGDPLAIEELAALELPRPRRDGDALVAHALLVDVYGNVTLNVRHEDLPASGLAFGHSLEVTAPGRTVHATFTGTFADVPAGELLVYEDASRTLALAVNRGDAAAELQLEPDDEVRLTPR
jgi:S-adenosyl-L-methionine hydrolase (adenosine-forming)